ncbi:hypothetical protein CH298_02710 [Rhodococcoides fascians]|uniref:phage terminase small subunit n=1 Tax=Rhodococcoides fascians TaxID=1828 RepID=UPI000B9AA2BB|nr:hypothetical protein [Rhodococcus fascians]OZE92768.1 hypothetical protein CH303_02710 [Rhodococcus fascians]OZF23401.1 hypothetical protein CH298_02710 [Rhodococcus fascians]OZF25115.1 hypothetical protein CH297_02710 [Rhodococcus fascians]OZF72683.1 hypothetical protein CH308_02715 [Rhodococcus fascians]OZF73982.1 hypothetical protein CH307_02710 [Rhodococcus fascians]
MAGRGSAPKDPSRRARTNKDPQALRVIHAEPVKQPALPTFEVENDGILTEFRWPARTQEWWTMWADSPLSAEFTSTDWSELLDTALLHAKFWSGSTSVASELRLRVAKFGATPEDRARLRIQFAQADQAEGKTAPAAKTSRERRGPLKAV